MSKRESNSPSIAVAHEHYYERGGGEVVAEELARTFNTEIFTGFVNDGTRPDDVSVTDLFGDGVLGRIIRGSTMPQILLRDAYYSMAWESVEALREYDTIIQSGNNPGWLVPKDDQTIVKYVHSPPRNPYDQFHNKPDSRLGRVMKRGYAKAARQLYQETVSYPEIIVANSELVAERCRKFWGIRDSDRLRVVYPPVDVETYGPSDARTQKDYYFTFSRLTEKKRIGQLIEAVNDLEDARLVVGGKGPDRNRLERLAGPSVEFVGYMSEDEKRRRLAECKAFLFNAQNEDFGLCPVEAMAAGTPVLGVRDGYTKYQVRDGENGLLFDPETTDIRRALHEFDREGVAWTPGQIQTFAEQYSEDRFRTEMQEIVREAEQRSTPTPDHDLPPDATESAASEPPALADGGDPE